MTAAVTTRDPLAVALIRGLREQGVSVPDQFAIVAYDNLEWSPLVEPPLSNAYADSTQVTAAVRAAIPTTRPKRRPRLICTVAGMDG